MTNKYESPLSSRYASPYMLELFSSDMRYRTWRKLWVSLAKAASLGISGDMLMMFKATSLIESTKAVNSTFFESVGFVVIGGIKLELSCAFVVAVQAVESSDP